MRSLKFSLEPFSLRNLLFVLLFICSGLAEARDFAVYGEIGKKYASIGGPNSFLGPPISSEAPAPKGGRYNNFRNGSIYWHPKTGAHVIFGAIRGKWLEQLGEGKGFLGYPTTDELTTPDGRGRYNHFLRPDDGAQASIYWTPTTGPVEVYGDIRKKWAALGSERSSLGYPTQAELTAYEGSPIRLQPFEHGRLFWSPKTGVTFEDPIAYYTPGHVGAVPRPTPPVPSPPPRKELKYCVDLDCEACKRDNLTCEQTILCTNPRAAWGCFTR